MPAVSIRLPPILLIATQLTPPLQRTCIYLLPLLSHQSTIGFLYGLRVAGSPFEDYSDLFAQTAGLSAKALIYALFVACVVVLIDSNHGAASFVPSCSKVFDSSRVEVQSRYVLYINSRDYI